MKPLRLLFMGTAPIAVPALLRCFELQGIELLAVVTQPPARRGRGRKILPSAVHQAALDLGLPVRTPKRFAGDEGDAILDEFEPDSCLVMAYGQIIKEAHLNRCPKRWLNLHGSLLPRWRGAAPIERCLEAGDAETGVQLMQMETGLDSGPVYAERRIRTQGHNAESLGKALANEAAALSAASLLAALTGQLEPVPQDPAKSCYAHRIQNTEGFIDFLGAAESWAQRSRAFDPRLGLRCRLKTQEKESLIKIWGAEVVSGIQAAEPGVVLRSDKGGLWVSCQHGVLNIVSLQLDGKKRLLWSQFRSGLNIQPGDCFD
jgi:methionyl-tRNA formyltransferase